jgi:hypothetical protein
MSEKKPQRAADFLEKDLGDEVVLYSPTGRVIHVLNRTAYSIWTLCDGVHSVEDMEKKVRSIYALPNAGIDVQADIRATLQTFTDKGLLLDD